VLSDLGTLAIGMLLLVAQFERRQTFKPKDASHLEFPATLRLHHFDRYVRSSDGPVRLQLGRDGPQIEATVKRSANLNGTARIYGRVALRDWFRSEFKLLDAVSVDLSSQSVIVLDKH
jgi:hypothetical protein